MSFQYFVIATCTPTSQITVGCFFFLRVLRYLLPQVYDALVASRDEAMYRKMVRKCKEFAADSLVVVVGAGHANGILQHVRQRGLWLKQTTSTDR